MGHEYSQNKDDGSLGGQNKDSQLLCMDDDIDEAKVNIIEAERVQEEKEIIEPGDSFGCKSIKNILIIISCGIFWEKHPF
jgi:hypothetical protein